MSEWSDSEPIGLDLGWTVIRKLSAEQQLYLQHVKRENRTRAEIALRAGIRLAQYRRLTQQQIDEVWYGMGWLLRPHLNPRIGTVVNPDKVAALRAPPRPQPKPRKPYTRKAKAA